MSNIESFGCGIWLPCCAKSASEENRYSDVPETKKRISVISETSALLNTSYPVIQTSSIQNERDLPKMGLPSMSMNIISATTPDNSSGWGDSYQGTTDVLEYM